MPQHATSRAEHARAIPPSGYDEEEQAYADWARRFVRRLRQRLPDEGPHRLEAALAQWAHHYQRLSPEEAAEVAAMWWQPAYGLRCRAS